MKKFAILADYTFSRTTSKRIERTAGVNTFSGSQASPFSTGVRKKVIHGNNVAAN